MLNNQWKQEEIAKGYPALRTFLEDAYGITDVSLITPVAGGDNSYGYEIETSGKPLFLKFEREAKYKENTRDKAAHEFASTVEGVTPEMFKGKNGNVLQKAEGKGLPKNMQGHIVTLAECVGERINLKKRPFDERVEVFLNVVEEACGSDQVAEFYQAIRDVLDPENTENLYFKRSYTETLGQAIERHSNVKGDKVEDVLREVLEKFKKEGGQLREGKDLLLMYSNESREKDAYSPDHYAVRDVAAVAKALLRFQAEAKRLSDEGRVEFPEISFRSYSELRDLRVRAGDVDLVPAAEGDVGKSEVARDEAEPGVDGYAPGDFGEEVGAGGYAPGDYGDEAGVDGYAPGDYGDEVGVDGYAPGDYGDEVGVDGYAPGDFGEEVGAGGYAPGDYGDEAGVDGYSIEEYWEAEEAGYSAESELTSSDSSASVSEDSSPDTSQWQELQTYLWNAHDNAKPNSHIGSNWGFNFISQGTPAQIRKIAGLYKGFIEKHPNNELAQEMYHSLCEQYVASCHHLFDEEYSRFTDHFDALEEQYTAIASGELPTAIIHKDANMSNFRRGGDEYQAIDIDAMVKGPRIIDAFLWNIQNIHLDQKAVGSMSLDEQREYLSRLEMPDIDSHAALLIRASDAAYQFTDEEISLAPYIEYAHIVSKIGSRVFTLKNSLNQVDNGEMSPEDFLEGGTRKGEAYVPPIEKTNGKMIRANAYAEFAERCASPFREFMTDLRSAGEQVAVPVTAVEGGEVRVERPSKVVADLVAGFERVRDLIAHADDISDREKIKEMSPRFNSPALERRKRRGGELRAPVAKLSLSAQGLDLASSLSDTELAAAHKTGIDTTALTDPNAPEIDPRALEMPPVEPTVPAAHGKAEGQENVGPTNGQMLPENGVDKEKADTSRASQHEQSVSARKNGWREMVAKRTREQAPPRAKG